LMSPCWLYNSDPPACCAGFLFPVLQQELDDDGDELFQAPHNRRQASAQAPANLDLIPMVSRQRVHAADCMLFVPQQEFGDEGVRQLRARQQEEKRAAAQATVDANLIPLGARKGGEEAGPPTPAQDAIPEVEWWDARILVHPESYAAPMESDRHVHLQLRFSH